jgi:plastocyanin
LAIIKDIMNGGRKSHGPLRMLVMVAALVLSNLPGEAAAPTFQIVIESGSPYFLPAAAWVAPGAPIRWDNPTPSHHTVTHDNCLAEEPCAFDSGSLAPSQSYTLPGLSAGRYPYHCRLHPIMRGTLFVTAPAVPPSQT